MSRHRMLNYLDYEEELMSDEDADYYGRSFEEDSPITDAASQYLYTRNRLASSGPSNREEFIPEESGVDEHDEMFQMDESQKKGKAAFKIGGFAASGNVSPSKNPPQPAKTPAPQKLAVPPVVKQLRASEKGAPRGTSKSPHLTPNSSSNKLSALETAVASAPVFKQRSRPTGQKDSINLVIIGHVDAGKSTLMGHLLFQIGAVDKKTLNRYKQEAARSGKPSFFYAWVLDETEEERNRGVTMDIARACFETDNRKVHVLDAPGHKDFIPNMITGASQADAALLVVDASRGEFETGFDQGGQTREHALLARSLGVSSIVVVVNKLDTTDWSKNRFDEIQAILNTYLKRQAGFSKVTFVPVSGLGGINLTEKPPKDHPLTSWYSGPTLVDALEGIPPPERAENMPLRIVVNDVLKVTTNAISLSAKVEAGHVEAGDKVFIMPRAEPATIKGISVDNTVATTAPNAAAGSQICFAGDQVLITVSGSFENECVSAGTVICRGGQDCLIPAKKIVARLVVFDIKVPIIRGAKVELFVHSTCAPCTIKQLKCTLNKSNGEILKEKPRFLTKNSSALVELETDFPVNLEPYSKCKALGRITLRANGETICAGIIDQTEP